MSETTTKNSSLSFPLFLLQAIEQARFGQALQMVDHHLPLVCWQQHYITAESAAAVGCFPSSVPPGMF
jgi:hypothetical protein